MMRNSIPCLGIIRIRCKGFDLSLSFNPQADKAPLLVSAAKIQLFSICQAKKDSLREWSTYYSHKAAVKTGS